jgi:periplasmic copper chaperone A
MMPNKMMKSISFAALFLLSTSLWAEVSFKEGWVRSTVEEQRTSGAFMVITSSQEAKLVAIQTPIAHHAEVHSMTMEKGVMKMRPLPSLTLHAGQAVSLKPDTSYHIMLEGLKKTLKVGDSVPLNIGIQNQSNHKVKWYKVVLGVRANDE